MGSLVRTFVPFGAHEEIFSIRLGVPYSCNMNLRLNLIFSLIRIMEYTYDPKRIQRRLRKTQNTQRQLRTLRMASADRESVGPRPSFGETLVSFGPLLDLDTLVEVGVPRRS
jgi:hypothetical protein